MISKPARSQQLLESFAEQLMVQRSFWKVGLETPLISVNIRSGLCGSTGDA